MDEAELAGRIDHTVLGPTTTPADVRRVTDEAIEYETNVCVPPCYVGVATERVGAADAETSVVTVVGFPHGQHGPGVKSDEATAVWEAGADEIDVVIDVGRLTAGQDGAVREELSEVVACVPIPVKVIVETPLLTDAEKHRAAKAAVDAGADYLKTATGFAEGGATVPDVELLADYLPVKASGGIGDYETAAAMFEAGAERIGASAGVEIIEDLRQR
ncbi:deoxyribose-phosphate aldolase [Halobacteriales archaeon SW_7_68_16]|nr:MAG: deoxyribose-phosphate aldolase [Halobacteriales archaeon SW_7_68_16]